MIIELNMYLDERIGSRPAGAQVVVAAQIVLRRQNLFKRLAFFLGELSVHQMVARFTDNFPGAVEYEKAHREGQ